ncbi:ATP synthase F1 subunit epsilon [bacterium]|nr:ATP synthase F1 subunit epsilon [bacterium]
MDFKMNDFSVEIVTPVKTVRFNDVKYLRFTGLDGKVGVMHNHAPAIMALGIGEIKIEEKTGKTSYLATSGGFTEIINNNAMILVETFELSEAIDKMRAEEAKNRALQRLKEKTENLDVARAEASLARALNRLKIAVRN